jgi:DNA-binding beta-propeller fold protein YncE
MGRQRQDVSNWHAYKMKTSVVHEYAKHRKLWLLGACLATALNLSACSGSAALHTAGRPDGSSTGIADGRQQEDWIVGGAFAAGGAVAGTNASGGAVAGTNASGGAIAEPPPPECPIVGGAGACPEGWQYQPSSIGGCGGCVPLTTAGDGGNLVDGRAPDAAICSPVLCPSTTNCPNGTQPSKAPCGCETCIGIDSRDNSDGRTGEDGTGGADSVPVIWDADRRCVDLILPGHTNSVNSVAVSPNGEFIASASSDHLAKIWRVSDGTMAGSLGGSSTAFWSIAYSPDGQLLATGSENSLQIWGIDGTVRNALSTLWTNGVAFSPDGKTLASGHLNNEVRLWDVSTGQLLKILAGHESYVTSVAFAPDGRTLASASWDSTVKLWDVEGGTEVANMPSPIAESIFGVAFAPNGTLVASVGGNALEIWSVESRTLKQALFTQTLAGLAFSPNGDVLATAGPQTWTFSVADGSLLTGLGQAAQSVAYFPDGTKIVAGGPTGSLVVYCTP